MIFKKTNTDNYDLQKVQDSVAASLTDVDKKTRGISNEYDLVMPRYAPASKLPLQMDTEGNVTAELARGVTNGSDAAAGYPGEYVQSLVGSTSFAPSTTGQFKDITSLTLTAGDWDLTGVFYADKNGATVTNIEILIGGTVSGNNSTGGVIGSNYTNMPTGTNDGNGGSIPNYRVSISSSTTYYMKIKFNFTVATPNYAGRFSARRIR